MNFLDIAIPSKVGQHTDHTANGITIRCVKVARGVYHARPEPQVCPSPEGPSFTRWGDAIQIRQDLWHFYRHGSLPFNGATVA
jgi:hypothetical protein